MVQSDKTLSNDKIFEDFFLFEDLIFISTYAYSHCKSRISCILKMCFVNRIMKSWWEHKYWSTNGNRKIGMVNPNPSKFGYYGY